jgi:uncharacterized membrane protein YdjX (TVP38/TMEM64 family)
MPHNKEWRYKNISLLIFSIALAFFLSRFEPFHELLLNLGELGYLGIFIGGMLFVSTFTVTPGIAILLVLSEKFSPLQIGIFAGLGAVLGDFLIFRFVKDSLAAEVTDIYNHLDRTHHMKRLLHSRHFRWMLPVIGAIIIATPFPDELGVGLMGLSHMKTYQFILLSFILNAIGIFLIISASIALHPY